MKKIVLLILILPLSGMWFLGQGSWIHTRAILAQVLLNAAWAGTAQGVTEAKAWPWTDSWPVSRLSVPRLGINRIVLAGANGPALAFGPGHLFTSAQPGSNGNVVITGHRDTHFSFLQHLDKGDIILLQDRSGTNHVYRVTRIFVTTSSDTSILKEQQDAVLTLITCYPFDTLVTGGPQRYVVTAVRTTTQAYI